MNFEHGIVIYSWKYIYLIGTTVLLLKECNHKVFFHMRINDYVKRHIERWLLVVEKCQFLCLIKITISIHRLIFSFLILENCEMFPQYYMYSVVCNKFINLRNTPLLQTLICMRNTEEIFLQYF